MMSASSSTESLQALVKKENSMTNKYFESPCGIELFLLSLRLSPECVEQYKSNLCVIGFDDMRAVLDDIMLCDFTTASIKKGHVVRIIKVLLLHCTLQLYIHWQI